jgi:hypothetical protein
MLFQKRTDPRQAEASRRVKEWARALWSASEDDTIAVNELRCSEPGCPPIETVVALLCAGGAKQQLRVHKPVLEVTHEDLKEALEGRHEHGST